MITLTKDDTFWVVSLNRPEKANSLTAAMLEELCEIIEGAGEARVLVLTGEGKVFSAGADLMRRAQDLQHLLCGSGCLALSRLLKALALLRSTARWLAVLWAWRWRVTSGLLCRAQSFSTL